VARAQPERYYGKRGRLCWGKSSNRLLLAGCEDTNPPSIPVSVVALLGWNLSQPAEMAAEVWDVIFTGRDG